MEVMELSRAEMLEACKDPLERMKAPLIRAAASCQVLACLID